MASWNVGVPFKSCLFPWGWFSKGSLAGMRSKETAFKMSFKSVKNQICWKVPHLQMICIDFPIFPTNNVCLPQGHRTKTWFWLVMKVAPSGFCLEPLHAKHPSRKQDNSLEKNRRWRSKVQPAQTLFKPCVGHHVGCSEPFFPQGLILRWTGMNPSSFLNSERCRGCLMFFGSALHLCDALLDLNAWHQIRELGL